MDQTVICQKIYDELTRATKSDYSLAQTLNELSTTGAFSAETLELFYETSRADLSSKQNAYLRTCLKSRNDEKAERICRYISLGADGVPKVSFLTVTHLSYLAESNMCDRFACSPESRVGIAHALLALAASPIASNGHRNERLIERYPELISLFAEHHDRVIDIHWFIEERGLNLDDATDVEQIKGFLSLDAMALSPGLL